MQKAISLMERTIIDVQTVVNSDGVYMMMLDSVSYEVITHAMNCYQKKLDSSNKWANKKRGDVPKNPSFKGRPRIVFHLNELPESAQNIIQVNPEIKNNTCGDNNIK